MSDSSDPPRPADEPEPAGPRDADHYTVVEDGPEVETRIKGSRFLAQTLAAPDPQTAATKLDAIRKRAHDATHHCWAHRWGPPGAVQERAEDDGEPTRTAGEPILRAIRHDGRHDALVVVTRWFGGTKLGTGGLARAYGGAAAGALAAAGGHRVWRLLPLTVDVGYDDLGAVEAVLARAGAHVHAVERLYQPDPCFRIHVRRSVAAALAEALTEETAGRARIQADPPRERSE